MRARPFIVRFSLALVGAAAFMFIFYPGVQEDSPRAIALGRKLFFDSRLSASGKTSCATCHVPSAAFTDGRMVAVGDDGRPGTRNTPSLTSTVASGRTSFFWDGRRDKLKDAVMDPFSNPVEMGLHDRASIEAKVAGLPDYPRGTAEVDMLASALAAYVRNLPMTTTRFEQFTHGDDKAISEQEKLGMRLFTGKGQCGTCHRLENARLSDDSFHRSGVSIDDIALALPNLTAGVLDRGLAGSALGDRVATHSSEAQLGHFAVSHKVSDLETFSTPSLRNVRLTAPYMHDGSVITLDDAVDREVYYRGLDTGYPIGLTAQERGDLKAFLETL